MYNKTALKELKKLLIKNFSDHIDKIVLFGSQVNGTARKYSDYDILLILKKPYDWKFENNIYDTTFDIDLEYNIITDIKMISIEELQTLRGKQPFIQNAINEGIELNGVSRFHVVFLTFVLTPSINGVTVQSADVVQKRFTQQADP